MPSGTHRVTLDRPIQDIWHFVSDINNWAPLVPGYTKHSIQSDCQSTWTIKGEVGIMQKTVILQINITKWKEPSLVTFDLIGLNENVSGSGYFEIEMVKETEAQIAGNLDIIAKGMMGPMTNSILKSVVPIVVEKLTKKVANELLLKEAVPK